jgi:hypothetical protein
VLLPIVKLETSEMQGRGVANWAKFAPCVLLFIFRVISAISKIEAFTNPHFAPDL